MQVQQIRIQTVGTGIGDPTYLAAVFQILISLQEFDSISTDAERIALINQIIIAINEVRG
jgi:hypothetical protein|tara:strand:+ start:949 stop:1128 length:180 start_codon:yes stop_codon:yes gene_type:complete